MAVHLLGGDHFSIETFWLKYLFVKEIMQLQGTNLKEGMGVATVVFFVVVLSIPIHQQF